MNKLIIHLLLDSRNIKLISEERLRDLQLTKAMNYALEIIKVDGLGPSEELLELVEKEKRGEITEQDIKNYLDKKYKK